MSPYSAGRDAGDDFHRLHRVGRNLVRIDAALLVGDRLVVDRELRLRVIADRMEEAVRVGDHARRRQRDHLVQPERLDSSGSLRDQALVDVGMGGRVALEEVLRVPDDLTDSVVPASVERHRRCRSGRRCGRRRRVSDVAKPCAVDLPGDRGSAAGCGTRTFRPRRSWCCA